MKFIFKLFNLTDIKKMLVSQESKIYSTNNTTGRIVTLFNTKNINWAGAEKREKISR